MDSEYSTNKTNVEKNKEYRMIYKSEDNNESTSVGIFDDTTNDYCRCIKCKNTGYLLFFNNCDGDFSSGVICLSCIHEAFEKYCGVTFVEKK
jgi:hypothetical protein